MTSEEDMRMMIEGNQKELDAMEQFHKGNRQEGTEGDIL